MARGPHRPSIALLPFRISQARLERGFRGHVIRIREKIQTGFLMSPLLRTLTKTEKFDVVERERIDAIVKEQGLSERGMMSPERAVRMGRAIGADVLVIGEFIDFGIESSYDKIPFTRELTRKIRAWIQFEMRLVDAHTTKIISADKIIATYQPGPSMVSRRRSLDLAATLNHMKEAFVRDMTKHIVAGVFPLKVVDLDGPIITLNRGRASGMKAGSEYELVELGAAIVDESSGQILGRRKAVIGRIRVTEIEDNLTRAKLISGVAKKNARCRPAPVAVPGPRHASPKRKKPNW